MTEQTGNLRIALAQKAPVVGETNANLVCVETTLAGRPDADLMVWPELYLCGYTTARAETLAESLAGDRVGRLRAAAERHETAIVIGFAERRDDGRVANSVLAIDRDGRIAGCYRKIQLFGDEAGAFTPGDHLEIVELAGVRVGLMICFDIEFPEIARALAVGGAELLLSVSANMRPFGPDHRLCVQARALENRRPHVYVNQVGQGETFLFTGDSCHADTAGRVRASCPPHAEALVLADVALAVETEVRPDYLALRRAVPAVRTANETQNSSA
ncbi:nitrilase-related carbon-nitrogen hydrolase [Salinisphaera sp.]|uniref:nitrilase-related carbon-nitrogen hydrolase n=1 Tax=Salinisphaera sp. TaxID=1914330 RepID=UPI002D79D799|nr:nitrilase-related carbon-nitrogen hydrolase [Salinisphaera sp.]HET7313944.1 nitrilase-related carbon-nitrogen hydrolase [Salinisphaera sp.]